jgi:peptidoglycan hydrolase CwlO-like protein
MITKQKKSNFKVMLTAGILLGISIGGLILLIIFKNKVNRSDVDKFLNNSDQNSLQAAQEAEIKRQMEELNKLSAENEKNKPTIKDQKAEIERQMEELNKLTEENEKNKPTIEDQEAEIQRQMEALQELQTK